MRHLVWICLSFGCGGDAAGGGSDMAMSTGGTTGGSTTGGSTTGGSTTAGTTTAGTTTAGTTTGSTTGGTTAGTTTGGSTTGGSTTGGSTTGGTTGGNSDMGGALTGCGSGGSSPTAGPADLFLCDSPWYKDVSSLSPASGSSTMIGAISQWEKSDNKFMIDFSMVILYADQTTPTHTFTLDPSYDPDNDHDAVPVPMGGAVEGNPGYTCSDGGDCHLLVIDRDAHKLYELWQADITNGVYTATQESVWDLNKKYTDAFRGFGCTSADASGQSITSGLIGVREVVKDGVINHALRFTMPNAYILADSWQWPATHGTGGGSGGGASSTTGPAYGARLRLKASAATAKASMIKSKGAKAIVAALQKYGMILADGSNYDTLIAEDDRLTKLEDPTLTWTGTLAAGDLSFLAPGDFEVVDYGTVQHGDNCVRAP